MRAGDAVTRPLRTLSLALLCTPFALILLVILLALLMARTIAAICLSPTQTR